MPAFLPRVVSRASRPLRVSSLGRLPITPSHSVCPIYCSSPVSKSSLSPASSPPKLPLMTRLSQSRPHTTLQPTTKLKMRTHDARPGEPIVHDVYEPQTGTLQYIVADPDTKICVIIDPVLDFDDAQRHIRTDSADALLDIIKENGYRVERILETHAHADHLTAASYLQSRLGQGQNYRPPVGIGKRIKQIQALFGERYRVVPAEYHTVFDELFEDDAEFHIGDLHASVMHLPGHTPDHVGYRIGDNVFCGDSLFHADIGTARCDFPGGNADDLWNSGRRLLSLPGHVKIWTGHDYPPSDRSEPVPYLTVDGHRAQNRHVRDGVTRDEFVALRTARDATLGEPRLLHQSLQINIRGGKFPQPNAAGQRMLMTPFKFEPKNPQW